MSGKHRSDAGQPASSRTAIPPGTRDVLPEEMRELRDISSRMRTVFEGAGYGEVHTPALEYEEVLRRAVERGVGEPREFLQGGLELIGEDGPEGDAEVVALTIEALDAVGLKRHRVGIGDGSLYQTLLRELEVPGERHMPLLECLSRRDLVGLERVVADVPERELLVELP